MKKAKKEKRFDSVKMMRDIRTKISGETQNMSFEELKKYIQTRIEKNRFQTIQT